MIIANIIQFCICIILLIGLICGLHQAKQLNKSIKIGQKANLVGVITHCASRYETIISTDPKDEEVKIGSWWYSYWNLITEEFNFFCKGLLDSESFEIWMNELSTGYNENPYGLKLTRIDSHKKYLKNTLPSYKPLHNFFERLMDISKEKNSELRANEVHALIQEFAPDDASFEIGCGK